MQYSQTQQRNNHQMKTHSLIHQYFSAVVSHLSSAPIPLSLRSGRSCWRRGQSSRVSPVLDFLLAVLSCSLSLPYGRLALLSCFLTLFLSRCDVTSQPPSLSLALSLSRPFRHFSGDSAWKETTKKRKTHTRVILFRFSPSLTHTLP